MTNTAQRPPSVVTDLYMGLVPCAFSAGGPKTESASFHPFAVASSALLEA